MYISMNVVRSRMDAGVDSGCGYGPNRGRPREADPFAARAQMWGDGAGCKCKGTRGTHTRILINS